MKQLIGAVLTFAAAMTFASSIVQADTWDKKTIFTFSGPVEIPGQVLPAGTYVFRLADLQSDRNVVQVFSKDERHLFGTFLALPDYRMTPTDKPVITFEERPAGSPEAVKAWFYPGANYGNEFVYPKKKARALAAANHVTVPSMPDAMAENTIKPASAVSEPHIIAMKQAPLMAQQPSGEEVILLAAAAPPPETASLPAELPHTAGIVPLVGVAGVLALVCGVGLLAVRRAR